MNAYESVINNENLKVQIILPPKTGSSPKESASSARGSSLILGYLDNPFSVEASAEWSDKLFGLDYAKDINALIAAAGSNISVYTILDTTQQYIVAQNPSFTLSFYVIATNSNINPMKSVMRLYEAIYPEKANDATIRYHWGYTPNALGDSNGNIQNLQGKNPTTGTVIVTIGKWFRAINMIIVDVKMEYSETLGPNGKPIWVKPSITVKPRRLPYANEFTQMFLP